MAQRWNSTTQAMVRGYGSKLEELWEAECEGDWDAEAVISASLQIRCDSLSHQLQTQEGLGVEDATTYIIRLEEDMFAAWGEKVRGDA